MVKLVSAYIQLFYCYVNNSDLLLCYVVVSDWKADSGLLFACAKFL